MKAKKHLGQHFLNSPKALREMVESAEINSNDYILEIGPGKGVLTEKILENSNHVFVIEKDKDMLPILEERFKKEIENKKLKIIEGDILKFSPEVFFKNKKYKIVANIPYYITGAIIEKFLSTQTPPTTMSLLIQKEVAERIMAKDNKQSVLSVAINAYGEPFYISKVPKGAFNPPPKVDSAVLAIKNISKDFFQEINEEDFFSLVKSIFGKKRKQVQSSLADFLNDKALSIKILNEINIDPKERPENFSLIDWKKLALNIKKSVQ